MTPRISNKTSLAAFVMLSLSVHLLGGYFMGFLSPFDLSAPVTRVPVVKVTLENPDDQQAPPAVNKKHAAKSQDYLPHVSKPVIKDTFGSASKLEIREKDKIREALPKTVPESATSTSVTKSQDVEPGEVPSITPKAENTDNTDFASVPVPSLKEMITGPLLNGGEFVPVAREKLTYRIMLFGVPAGTAVLEATNKNEEMRITTRVNTNDVFSSFYPVDIFVDTRLTAGNYLLTRIRQREGSTVSDTGFTLMLRERNAFWVDRLNKRYANSSLPREDVKDMISGFYYLRNQQLEVGRPVELYLFDSNQYIPTTVEVLRKEHLKLPGFRNADTLVVHPILKTDGFFHSTGEILVWLTDDDKKVPVKVEAQISLGKVTAELVSAESEKTSVAGQGGEK